MPAEKPHSPKTLESFARTYFPDGEINQLGLPDDLGLIVSDGAGCRVRDIQGREYIDFMMGMGPLILGHAHPKVTDAVSRQLAKGTSFYTLNEPAIKLADEICRTSECAEKIRFTTSGTEATLGAIRFAKAFTGKNKILKFEGAFHGGHDLALMSMAPRQSLPFPQATPDSAGISESIAAEVLVAPFNDLETTRKIIQSNAKDIACVIVEPLQRYIAPIAGFLEGLRRVSCDHDILLIFDEVVTGFRLAYGGAQEYYGVTPDIVAYGKALGGGFPIGAIASRADIIDLCSRTASKGKRIFQSGTLSGNPISSVAALATLEELRTTGTYQHLHSIGSDARQGLQSIFQRNGVPAQVLGDGAILNIVFTNEPVIDYQSSMRADRKKSIAFHTSLLRQGFLVNPYGRMYLSTVHTSDDLEALFKGATNAIADL